MNVSSVNQSYNKRENKCERGWSNIQRADLPSRSCQSNTSALPGLMGVKDGCGQKGKSIWQTTISHLCFMWREESEMKRGWAQRDQTNDKVVQLKMAQDHSAFSYHISKTHTHAHTHTLTHPHARTHAHTLTHSLTHSLSHTHTHTRTHASRYTHACALPVL